MLCAGKYYVYTFVLVGRFISGKGGFKREITGEQGGKISPSVSAKKILE